MSRKRNNPPTNTEKEHTIFIELGAPIFISEIELEIYEITKSKPKRLAHKKSDSAKNSFEIPTDRDTYYYATARVLKLQHKKKELHIANRPIQLVSVFSSKDRTVYLNERSTVATAYCFAQFIQIDPDQKIRISDPEDAAKIAFGMKNNFVETRSGDISPVIASPPNGLQSNSMAVFNYLANMAYYCAISPEIYAGFTALTRSGSLFEGLFNLAHDPFTAVEAIYDLIGNQKQIFTPSLPDLRPPATPAPDQWTLAVKVNDSGAENFMIAGTGYLAFDKNDRVWVSNNVRQGTPNSSTFCTVLEPDGKPAAFSPLFGGGLLGGGIGITADSTGENMYIGNFGWGPMEWNPQTGSISVFSHKGEILSPPNGITNHLSRVQGMAFDHEGNLWICSWGTQAPLAPAKSKFNFPDKNSSVVVYLKGDPEHALVYEFDSPKSPYHMPFGICVDDDGHVYIANSGNPQQKIKSSVYKFSIEKGEIRALASWTSEYVADPKKPLDNKGVEGFRMMGIGPRRDIFIVGIASNRVVRLDRDLNYLGDITNQVFAPWGITFDRKDVMYVANFNSDQSSDEDEDAPFGVTIIKDADGSTAKLMTLPTGGEEVTLANGFPLYGNAKGEISFHCYDPLMRMTATRIDRAGNLWACNNWKPSAAADLKWGDPGGDGLVIFVGVAAPAGRL